MIESGQLVLLVSPKGKRYIIRLEADSEFHTNDGKILHNDIIEGGYGARVKSHLGRAYLALRPTLYDLVKNVRRQTQIIYPKDISQIIMRLGIGPGSRVVEAGSGSGSMTTALAWHVGPQGKVYTSERREEFKKLCARNLRWAGLDDGRVEQFHRDVCEEGFPVEGADALFLDMRTPWECLEYIPKAVIPGSPVGFLLPTTNQVSDLLRGLEDGPFGDIDVVEVLLRRWKPIADRLRPDDRMVAHTGFLVFCRCYDEAE